MRFNTLLLGTLAASAIATDHTVTIGGDNLDQYSPAEIKAEKGDTITFQLLSGSHDIVQGSFDKPCEPLSGGFYSLIFSVNRSTKAGTSTTSPSPQPNILTITDTLPKWFYCSRGDHCKNGMVGVINAPSSKDQTLANYKKAAKNVAKAGRPDGSSSSALGINATSLASASTSAPSIVSTLTTSLPTSSFENSTMSASTTSSTITIPPSGPTSTTSQPGTSSKSSTAPKSTTGAAASNMGGSAVGLVALVAGAIIFG